MRITFVFFTSVLQHEDSIPVKFSPLSNSWEKTSRIFAFLYDHFPKVQWYMKIDDDTIIYWDNLKNVLLKRDLSKPLYIGYPLRYGNFIFASGGAGYILSNRSLDILIENDFQRNCEIVGQGLPRGPFEDVTMGKCLLKFGIEVTDQIGFHPHTPEQMVRWTLKGDSYDHVRKEPLNDTAYPPITYHYITPQRLLIMSNKTRHIPKIIYQVWLDTLASIPQQMDECERIYRSTGWTYLRWTSKTFQNNIHSFQFIHKDLLNDSKINISEKNAIARYEILYHYGGVFIDGSLHCISDLSLSSVSLDRGGDSLLLFNFPTTSQIRGQFINRYLVLGSVQYSDIILALIYNLPERVLEHNENDGTTAIHSRFIQSVLSRFHLPHDIVKKDAQHAFQLSHSQAPIH